MKKGYCPVCDKEIEIETDEIYTYCSECGHHISLSEKDEIVDEKQ